MKNFRKVLALILVVATLFSFVAMASAKTADEYKDYADVKYTEAVDVLTAIGITEGYNGSYHPNDPIGRDEVAAMVARLRNGGDIDAKLYVGADKVFADVKGQWSEGYVTYCTQLGIVAGRNATTFDPEGKVTGTEVLKMLLCVLGYDAKEQGYTGANWQVNVVRDAKKAGLLIDGVDVYAAATRDEVAQYFLNALNANMVIGYLSDSIVKITNSIWADFESYSAGTVTPDSIKNGAYEVTYCNAIISQKSFLMDSISGLTKNADNDCYMRPGHNWKIGTTTIGFYADAATATWTDADKTTVQAKVAADSTVYVDGKGPATDWNVGNGVLVEYYAAYKRVVIVNTYIGRVANVSKYYGTFDIVSDNAKASGKLTASLADYDVANGDVVLFWLCGAKTNNTTTGLHDVKVVTPVNVNVTAADLYKDSQENVLYADGKTYKYSYNLGSIIDPSIDALHAWDSSNYDLYLDEYGYIMYYAVPATETVTNYAYLVEGTAWKGNYSETVGVGSWDYTASLVNFGTDGAKEVEAKFAIDAEAYANATVRYYSDKGSVSDHIGTLISYTVENGNFVFDGEAKYAKQGAKLSKDSWEIDEGIYCTSATKFMIRSMNLDGTYSYEQITGYENLKGTYIAETVKAWGEGAWTNLTNIQFFMDPAHADFASYVFIDAKATAASADHFLVLNQTSYVRWETALKTVYGQEYFVYDAIVDGKRAMVASHVELMAGNMYDDALAFYGFSATLGDNTNLELYVYANYDQDAKMKVVSYTYEVVAGEVYVKWVDDANKTHMNRLASDATVYGVKATYDASTGKYVMTLNDYVITGEMTEGGKDYTAMGYIYLDGNYISELYVLTGSYFCDYLGQN